MSGTEGSYFSFSQPRTLRSSRRYDLDLLSPGTEEPVHDTGSLTPGFGGPLTPKPTPTPLRFIPPTPREDDFGSSRLSKQRRTAVPAILSPKSETEWSSDTAANDDDNDDDADRASPDRKRSSLHSKPDSPSNSPRSTVRESSRPVTKTLEQDYFVNTLRSNEYNSHDRDKLLSTSSKAFKRLGLGDQEQILMTPKSVEASGSQKSSSSNVTKPTYRDRSISQSPSTSSNEDLLSKEESRHTSFWKNLAYGQPKTSESREKAGGLRIELASPNLSFLASEARKVTTPPKSAQPNYYDPHAKKSNSSLVRGSIAGPDTPRPSMALVMEPEDPKPDYRQDVFRAKVMTGLDEEAEKYIHVPEHLPTSPLCPRHPKHKSKGTGVCPYHGRN
ncbi:MAG: hypothetical protein LQ340_000340 [Diploschistes diacapsis]|nr:MAG: hypothetical protein LQ340_000340 [Diploschistes diacapsis]